jgi:hypothetical protein
MKGSVFWDVTPCSPFKKPEDSEEELIHLQGLRVGITINQPETGRTICFMFLRNVA